MTESYDKNIDRVIFRRPDRPDEVYEAALLRPGKTLVYIDSDDGSFVGLVKSVNVNDTEETADIVIAVPNRGHMSISGNLRLMADKRESYEMLIGEELADFHVIGDYEDLQRRSRIEATLSAALSSLEEHEGHLPDALQDEGLAHWICQRYGEAVYERYLATREDNPHLRPQAALKQAVFEADTANPPQSFGRLRFNSD